MIKRVSISIFILFLYSGCELLNKPKMVYIYNPPIEDNETKPIPPSDNNTTTPEDNNTTPPEIIIKERFVDNPSVNVDNPDRGFYDSDFDLNIEEDYNRFEDAKSSGYNLAYAPIDLENYLTTTTLPDTLLKIIDKNLKDATNVGIRLIFRVKYSSAIGQEDPKKEIALSHLTQLKPILQKYRDTISIVQAGVIGAWGEWHDMTGDYADSDSNYKENRKAIISKLVEIFPNKYIQIRTPMHKELLYGGSASYGDKSNKGMISQNIAFGNDIRAKIGHHNDCFLVDESDNGTYSSNDIEFWQDYVVHDSKFAPVGGETCRDSQYLNCANTLAEMKRYQYSYINGVFKKSVIERWKDEGCYQTIKEDLGYRLVAKELTITNDSMSMKIDLLLENRGFASPYIKSDMKFILDSGGRNYTFDIPIDSRSLYAGGIKHFKEEIDLEEIDSGIYTLYLQIGDGEFAIKLSNRDLWDSGKKLNRLKSDIVVE